MQTEVQTYGHWMLQENRRSAQHKTYHKAMLSWTVTFIVVALIAGVLGFTGIAGAAAGVAKICFFIFLILFIISLIRGRKTI
ncbi:MAG: rane protein ytjA [Verrucomicrobiales bacterium]|nr:rane protein ytjA [Verrucomicrobiales bacterium]